MASVDQVNEVLSHMKTVEQNIVTAVSNELSTARTKVKSLVGDVNGDGKVDLTDAKLRVETIVGKVGTEFATLETKAAGLSKPAWCAIGALIGYVLTKLLPFAKPLIAALF